VCPKLAPRWPTHGQLLSQESDFQLLGALPTIRLSIRTNPHPHESFSQIGSLLKIQNLINSIPLARQRYIFGKELKSPPAMPTTTT